MTQIFQSRRHKHMCPQCGQSYTCTRCAEPGARVLSHEACLRLNEELSELPRWHTLMKRGPLKVELYPGAKMVNVAISTPVGSSQRMYKTMPDMRSIRQTVRLALSRLPRVGARWPDGTLHGWKALRLFFDNHKWLLASPIKYANWQEAAVTAHDFDSEEMLRGKAGIHACWPARRLSAPGSGADIATSTTGTVLVELAGHGKCVTGELGWRSQHAVLKRIWLEPELVTEASQHVNEQLKAHYAPLGVEVRSWISEENWK